MSWTQLLSEAIGGKVRKMKTPEIGVLDVFNNDKSLFKGLNKKLKFYNGILMRHMICQITQIC